MKKTFTVLFSRVYISLSIVLFFFSSVLEASPFAYNQIADTSKLPKGYYNIDKKIIANKAVVSTAHPLATQVGLDIIKQGGNAIDAAVAVQFALAVVYPRAGNIGGGGFLVYRNGDGSEVSTLDYRERAPIAAYRNMYLDSAKNVIPGKSQKGHLAAGVPGTVDGCYKMFEKYSKLKDWKKLIQPAIELAKTGYAITETEARRLNSNRADFLKYNTTAVAFVKSDTIEVWKVGDMLVQPDLAHTLELIRDKGAAGFYEGETAEKVVAEMKRGGGIITLEDMKSYQATWRKPLKGNYRGYDLITMPPPSSGGVALLQLLGIVENYPLSKYGFHSVKSIHLMVEAERRVYADRAEHLGDADYYPVKVDKLTNRKYVISRFKDFKTQKATPSSQVTHGSLAEVSEQTTHLSIVDTEGAAVAITTTLNDNFGCRTVVGVVQVFF